MSCQNRRPFVTKGTDLPLKLAVTDAAGKTPAAHPPEAAGFREALSPLQRLGYPRPRSASVSSVYGAAFDPRDF